MRSLVGWTIKFSFLGVLYIGYSSGFHVKLPETVLGYKVPESARQWVDRTSQITAYGEDTKAGFEHIANGLK